MITMLLLFMTLWLSQAFWYFEERLFCNIDQQNVTIFLKNQEWTTKCQIYLDTIYQLAVQKYKEMSLIREYISEGEDVYYWKWVLEQKKSELSQMINYRIQIKNAMARFEDALFERYYNMIKDDMELYYSDIEIQYYTLINTEPTKRKGNHSLVLAELEQQMKNVSQMLEAENMDQLMEVVPSYLYLKKQLAWK